MATLQLAVEKPGGLLNSHALKANIEGKALRIHYYLQYRDPAQRFGNRTPGQSGMKRALNALFPAPTVTETLPLTSDGSMPFEYTTYQIHLGNDLIEHEIGDISHIYLWIEPYAYGCLLNPNDDEPFAKGVLKVPIQSQIPIVIHAVQGVVEYIVNEMLQNAKSPAVRQCFIFNQRAQLTYEHALREPATLAFLTQDDLTFTAIRIMHHAENFATDGQFRPKTYTENLYKMVGDYNFDLYKRDLIQHPDAVKKKTIILSFESYVENKEKALNLWTGHVHTNQSFLGIKKPADFMLWIQSTGMNLIYPGSPDWDHKPYIAPRWAHQNRLGNKPFWIFYDLWSNIHYGYVGKLAGFTHSELQHGANAQQQADTGSDDTGADKFSVKAGFELTEPTIEKVIAISNQYEKHDSSNL